MSLRLLAKMRIVFDRILGGGAVAAGVLIIFAMLCVCLEVTMRYFVGRPQAWVIEVTEYSILWMTFLGAAWVLKEEGHVKMEVAINRLKPSAQARLNFATSIVAAIICLVITWFSGRVFWNFLLNWELDITILEAPKCIIQVIIPIGSSLLFIQFLRRANGFLRSWRGS